MDKPKIFVFTTSYYPFIGGAEIAIQEVAMRLAHEFDFFIVTSRFRRDLPRREVRPEGTVIRLGPGTRFDKWLLPLVAFFHLRTVLSSAHPYRTKLGTKNPDCLLWAVDIGQGALAALIIKWLFSYLPFILTVQYGESEEYLRRGRLGFIRWAFRAMLGRADYVTAISTYLLDLSRDLGYCGPAEVIPNGVDTTKFQIPNSKLQTNPKSKIQNPKTVITVSRLAPKNGVDILIRAIAEVKKAIPEIQCKIIGDGPELKKLKLQTTNYKLQTNIEFLGAISHDDLPRYLCEADLFVRPSRSEGMGNAFVEALAAGLPIIGTPVGGITDIIEDGKTGLFVRPEDPRDLAEKIIRLLGDPALAERMANAGQAMVAERFLWEKIAQAYRRIFAPSLAWCKRVVVATGLFPPEIGGPATYSKLLVDNLPERGIGVRVAPFRSVRHLPRIVRHLAYFGQILRAGRGADIIFAQDPVSAGLPAMLVAKLLRKRFLLKITGDYAWEQYIVNQESGIRNQEWETLEGFQTKRFDFMTELRRSMQRLVARRADRIIVPSEYLKGIIKQWGVASRNIEVVYNSFSPPAAPLAKKEARERLGIQPDAFIIVSAGRLVAWKGFALLLAAMPAIIRKIPSARMIIIGSGPDEAALRNAITAAGLMDAVTLTGGVSHDDLLQYLRAGDLFILNSSYEGFSHTLLEAMAMEIPVMATAVGGNKEIVRDGAQGILYDRRDPETIARVAASLYTDSDLRRRLAQTAKRDLARFGKEEMIQRIIGMFSAV